MIQPEKYEHALHALHQGMCIARLFSYNGDSESAASVLDRLEQLPKYLIEPFDRTDDFRGSLETIAKLFRSQHLNDDFDAQSTPDW